MSCNYSTAIIYNSTFAGINVISLSARRFASNDLKAQKISKALIVTKYSNYLFERNRNRHLNDNEFEEKIKKRGSDYDKLIYYHELHKEFETNVCNTLTNMGIEVKVENRY